MLWFYYYLQEKKANATKCITGQWRTWDLYFCCSLVNYTVVIEPLKARVEVGFWHDPAQLFHSSRKWGPR